MTVYASIADSEIDPESPGTTTLFTKLRDNPISIAEGSSGAPVVVGSSMVLVETQTASASATLSFVTGISATYNHYIFMISGILPASNTSELQYQVSTNSGSSYLTTTIYDYKLTDIFLGGTADATINIAGSTLGKVALDNSFTSTYGISGDLKLQIPSNSSTYTVVKSDVITYDNSSTEQKNSIGLCVIRDATAVNAIKFFFNTGNIASGSISLYGIKK